MQNINTMWFQKKKKELICYIIKFTKQKILIRVFTHYLLQYDTYQIRGILPNYLSSSVSAESSNE